MDFADPSLDFTGTIAPLRVLSGETILFASTKDIQSVTTFRRNPAKFMKHLKKKKKPPVLTTNGQVEAVVHDHEVRHCLLDIAAQADAR